MSFWVRLPGLDIRTKEGEGAEKKHKGIIMKIELD